MSVGVSAIDAWTDVVVGTRVDVAVINAVDVELINREFTVSACSDLAVGVFVFSVIIDVVTGFVVDVLADL